MAKNILEMLFDLNSLIFLNLNSLVETKDEDITKRDLFNNINEYIIIMLRFGK